MDRENKEAMEPFFFSHEPMWQSAVLLAQALAPCCWDRFFTVHLLQDLSPLINTESRELIKGKKVIVYGPCEVKTCNLPLAAPGFYQHTLTKTCYFSNFHLCAQSPHWQYVQPVLEDSVYL